MPKPLRFVISNFDISNLRWYLVLLFAFDILNQKKNRKMIYEQSRRSVANPSRFSTTKEMQQEYEEA
jgi:hypothetical protein